MLLLKSIAPNVLYNTKLTRSLNFIQFFALAMTYNHDIAKEKINYLDSCLANWNSYQNNIEWAEINNTEKYEFIISIINSIVKEFAEKFKSQVPLLGFSSGLDSRLLLHCMKKHKINPILYTYGQVGNHDYDFSRIYAEKQNENVIYYDTSEIQWNLEDYDQITKIILDKPVSPRVATSLLMLKKFGSFTDIHGFLNDHITGSKLPKQKFNKWKCAKNVFLKDNDQFGFQKYLRKRFLELLLPNKPFSSNLDYYRQLDLGYRQFQRIRPVNFKEIEYVCPFEDERWVGFWLSRVHDELIDQSLYLDTIVNIKAEEFFDLNDLSASHKALTKKNRRNYIYGDQQFKRAEIAKCSKKILPLSAGSHFCFYACYYNNQSFKEMIDYSLTRIMNNKVFYSSFIDSVMKKFTEGDIEAERLLKGIVSIDICSESGVFFN